MRVIDAIPREVHFLTEFTFEELELLKLVLENMVFNYDGKSEEHMKAKKYLEEQLYPVVKKTVEDMRNGSR